VKTSSNTVLITGGGTGIGFCIAEEFVKSGNEVIICGRREEKLKEAKEKLPQIITKICDISNAKDREELFNWVTSNFKGVNVLVNNAGVQRMIDFKKGIDKLARHENEVDINFTSTIQLSAYFIPLFMQRKESAIINISSGLAFIPLAMMPVYCATKAAVHSFSVSLRHQLKNTPVKVFEVIPPTVDTELDKGTRAQRNMAYRGIPPSDVAVATMKALASDEYECAVEQAKNLMEASRFNFAEQFGRMNH
jgi:uncharacterized oxidoreductase